MAPSLISPFEYDTTMAVQGSVVLMLAFALLAATRAGAQEGAEGTGVRVVLKLYDDCSRAEAFGPCLKRKAVTFFDRLARMDRLALADNVVVVRDPNAAHQDAAAAVTEEQIDASLPRGADAQNEQLDKMLIDRVARFVGTRTLEVSMPKFDAAEFTEEGRKKGGGKGGMMHGMMMGIAAKMAALIPIAIAGLFLLAGKALITAKIALLLAGIIAIKKLFAQKQGGGGGHGGGWQSGGGGWQSSGGGGGGWDKRSFDEAHKLAYKAYAPK